MKYSAVLLATTADIKAIEAYGRAFARKDLLYYVQNSIGQYRVAPCHKEICAELMQFEQDVIDGKSPRLALFLPPRAGKSFIASERFPAWFIGRNPTKKVIATAYGYDLASEFTVHSRDLFAGQYHSSIFPDVKLSPSVQRADKWETLQGGGYYGVGVGGALTGMGADILIVDDPVKNWADALSESKRRSIWEWYTTTAYTRLMPSGGVLLIMTRWHPDDLGGRILEKNGFKVIKYPAISEGGESYDPVRWPTQSLVEIKETIGETAWRCLYMQEPTSSEGQLFKRNSFKFHAEEPNGLSKVCISVDATFKGGEGSDYVSIQAWGERERSYYLLDNDTRRMGFSDTLRAIIDTANRYSKYNPTIIIEDKANGPAIIETIKKQYSRVVGINPQGGKIARAQAVIPLYEAQRVSFPSNAVWLDRFINQLADFPSAKNDDEVDAMTQALTYLENHSHTAQFKRFDFL